MDNPDISQAVMVAYIASATSIISSLLTYVGVGANNRKSAVRELMNADLQKIGNAIYHLVAKSKQIIDAESDDRRARLRTETDEIRKEFKELRGRVRYSLWGIEDGLREINSATFYAWHYVHKKNEGKILVDKLTSLRKALDNAIVDAFHMGRPPTWRQRMIIAWRVSSVRRFHKKTDSRLEQSSELI